MQIHIGISFLEQCQTGVQESLATNTLNLNQTTLTRWNRHHSHACIQIQEVAINILLIMQSPNSTGFAIKVGLNMVFAFWDLQLATQNI